MINDRRTIIDLRRVHSSEHERVERVRDEALRQTLYTEPRQENRKDRPSYFSQDVVGGILRLASMALLVAGAWTTLPSVAGSLSYFMDTEASGSSMSTGFLEIFASTTPEAIEMSCGGMRDPEVHVRTEGNAAYVSASTTGAVGSSALCEAIELDVRHHGETLYSGPLSGFQAADILDGTMRFIASLPDDAGPFADDAVCTTTVAFEAVQQRHGGVWGFTDSDTVELAFSVDTSTCDSCDEPCDTCGDVYIDIVNDNDATIINDFDISASSGGNSAGEGGTVITGDSTTTVIIENTVNVNETIIELGGCCNGCGECDEPCADDCVPSDAGEHGAVEEGDATDETPEPTSAAEDLAAQIQAELDARLKGAFGNGAS